jgi:hypothetical protein
MWGVDYRKEEWRWKTSQEATILIQAICGDLDKSGGNTDRD